MAEVVRRPSLGRDIPALDARLRHSNILVAGRRRGPIPPWRQFGALGQPALLNGWGDRNGGVDGVPGFFLDERGVTWLRGHIGAAAPSSMVCAVLPEGFRPPQLLKLPVAGNYFDTAFGVRSWAFYQVLIGADGTLTIQREVSQVSTDQNVWLDSLSFAIL